MIRKIALAFFIAGAAALPAIAADTSAETTATPREFTAQLSAEAHQNNCARSRPAAATS